MKLLIDVNLAARWADMLQSRGIEACNWRSIGAAHAPDTEIMRYATANGFAVFTSDLDFSAILAATHVSRPSVIQLRAADTRPEAHIDRVAKALVRLSAEIERGAVITIDPHKIRLHILPFFRNGTT